MKALLYNCGEVAHLSTGDDEDPLSGNRLLDREHLVDPPGMGILVDSGVIEKIGPMHELVSEYAPWYPNKTANDELHVIDVEGMAVVPGFVDSHTHLVWSGDRSDELSKRISGMTYKDISESGGGIMKTVNSTRSSPQKQLVESGIRRLETALRNGTTSLEAKSGYGLDLDSEVKLLESISDIGRSSPCDVRPTWLGAHDFPTEMTRSQYVEHLISEQLPVISELSLANWVDVFCEDGWFTNEQTEEIVNAAKSHGLGSRLHVDEFVDGGGLALAAELGSVSGDHVACSNDDSRIIAAESGTVQTFLPGTPYVLGKRLDLPIMKCIEEDWPFSLASDFNPNCPITSIPLIGSMISHRLGVDPIATLVSVTRNPATTMFQGSDVRGVIAEGVIADMNILWSSSADSWCQTPGSSPVKHTLKNGVIVNSNKVY
ncbi:MAG TPA: imidazolonepropionase [Candidatus Thalassarchaeaceae archaeon]|jgi:imidazolonepropionase|nr:imidazolonepropionase [Candidatus Thalassarchaeaceae archaeon]